MQEDRVKDFFGTPLVTHSHELKKTQVFDSQGKSRFHGAFEGGFSAGFFNTVGSAEGWQPTKFEKGKGSRTMYDYMDEEDLANTTASHFSRNTNSELANNTPDSLIPGAIPAELLLPNQTNIGFKLFKLHCAAAGPLREESTNRINACTVGTHGLGYRGFQHHDSQEAPEVTLWKRKVGIQNDEKEGSDLSFHVVDNVDTEEHNVVSAVAQRILNETRMPNQLGAEKIECWPDGCRLPRSGGWIIAKAKSRARPPLKEYPVPTTVPVMHVFPPDEFAPRFASQKRILDKKALLEKYANDKVVGGPPLLSSRFVPEAKMVSLAGGPIPRQVLDDKSKPFVLSHFTFQVSPELASSFGIQINTKEPPKGAQSVSVLRPCDSQLFQHVFSRSATEKQYESSDDSQAGQDLSDNDANEQTPTTTDELNPRDKKKKKSKKKKKHKKKKHKRTKRSYSSSSSSNGSSEE